MSDAFPRHPFLAVNATSTASDESGLPVAREQHLEALLGHMAEGVVVQAPDGIVLECNRAAQRILQLSQRQIEGREALPSGWSATHEDGSPLEREGHPVSVILKTARSMANLVIAIDGVAGTRLWAKVNAAPLRLAPDQPAYGLLGTFSDISEQKAAEAQLMETQERLGRVIDGARDAIWDLNVATGHLFISTRLAEILGLSPLDIPQRVADLDRLLHPDDFVDLTMAFGTTPAGETAEPAKREYRFKHQDGHWVWILVRGRAVEWRDGVPTRISGTMGDVSKRRHAEDALRASEARLRGYFHSPAVGVVIVNTDHTYREVNDFFCAMLGYSREELVGRRWQEITYDEERALQEGPLDELAAGDRDTYSLEKRYIRKDGSLCWAQTSSSTVRTATGDVDSIVAIVHDITLRKQVEEEVLRSLDESETLVDQLRRAEG